MSGSNANGKLMRAVAPALLPELVTPLAENVRGAYELRQRAKLAERAMGIEAKLVAAQLGIEALGEVVGAGERVWRAEIQAREAIAGLSHRRDVAVSAHQLEAVQAVQACMRHRQAQKTERAAIQARSQQQHDIFQLVMAGKIEPDEYLRRVNGGRGEA